MKIRFYRLFCFALMIGGGLGFCLDHASAQQATPAQTAQSAASGLEEIVVTAQKRQENVQTVPIAIEAFNEHMLDTLQITDTTDLALATPGLNLGHAAVAAIPFLRGVGNYSGNPGNEPTIATVVDDVYLPSPSGSNYVYNNIARIEVLKGPQGTLFGRNAAGGVINIVTKDPAAAPHVDFSVGYANYNTITTNFYGTSAITDNLSADLAAYYENQADGWGRNLVTGKPVYLSREWSGRTKWVFTPNDAWKFRFIADYDRDRTDLSSAISILPGTTNLFGKGHTGGFYDQASGTPSLGEQKQYGLSLRIDHDLGWATGASITSWRRAASHTEGDQTDASVLSQYFYWNISKEADATQEFQLAAPAASTLKWIVGAFLFSDKAGQDPQGSYGYGQTSHAGSKDFLIDYLQTNSYAAYTQATAPVAPDTRFTLGLRYTLDTRDIAGRYYDGNGVIYNSGFQSKRYTKMTYRLALDHDFGPNVLGYISYNRGFKSGYFATGNPTSPVVGPEILDAYEIGLKSELLDHTLRLNVAAFYYNFSDIQVQELLTSTAITLNAAGAQYKGIDLDATYQPTQNFTLFGSLELLDDYYTSFPTAVVTFPCVTKTIAPACATSVNGGGYYQTSGNLAGYQLPFADPATGSVTATYRIPTDIGTISLVGTLDYHNGFYFDVQDTLHQPGYMLLNASAMWTSPSGAFDAKLWGHNLTGVEYYSQFQRGTTAATYSAQAPLTFGVTLGFHWDGTAPEAAYTPPAAPVAVVTPPPAAPAPTPEVQRAYQVFFDFDKSDITDAASKVIQAAAASVKAGNVTRINVTGHTDTVGSAAYNQGLSERRAAAVKQQLVADGVSDGEIATVGVGKTGLLVPTADGVREPQNRRAEIVLQ